MWLRITGQLLAEGRYDGNNFIVFRGVTGKTDLVGTTFFRNQLGPVAMGEDDRIRCEALLRPKLALIVQEVKAYVYVASRPKLPVADCSRLPRDRYGILHTDIQPGNILWDSAATRPTLIDWGRAMDVGVGQV